VNGMRSEKINWPDCTRGTENPCQSPIRSYRNTNILSRFKPEMWSKVAEEMAVPWRAAEAMHWQLGENDMARRAGVVPFSLSSVTLDSPSAIQHSAPARGHSHSQSHSGTMSSSSRLSRPTSTQSSGSMGRGNTFQPPQPARTIAARRESTPRSVQPPSPGALAALGGGMMGIGRGGGQMLPSVAELTTGVSPYSAYATSMPMPMSGGAYSSPGPFLPPMGSMQDRSQGGDGKRRGSPGSEAREASRRRQ
jgi:hypothetical protein